VQDKASIKIPRGHYQILVKMTQWTGFPSITEFIVFVMRNSASSGEMKGEDELTEEEVRTIRERLWRLGYL